MTRAGVDAAIVFAPSDAALVQAVEAVKPGGRIVLGVFARPGVFPFTEGKTLVGTVIGSRRQMQEVLRLAGSGRIKPVVETAPLEDAEAVLQRLEAGDIRAPGRSDLAVKSDGRTASAESTCGGQDCQAQERPRPRRRLTPKWQPVVTRRRRARSGLPSERRRTGGA